MKEIVLLKRKVTSYFSMKKAKRILSLEDLDLGNIDLISLL